MPQTRTGSFPIGFRRGWSPWQKDLSQVISFAKANDFAGIDVGDLPAEQIKPILSAGLLIGSVDVKQKWSALASADAGKRKDAVAAAAQQIKSTAALGVRNFFVVVFPEEDARLLKENFPLAVDGYAQLARAISATGARIVIEGYPGSHPYYPALCCTPASLREFFKETASDVLGVNFDPSHLIRMGIDPVRFLQEFVGRVGHVHAKDTQIMPEKLYEFGHLQHAALTDPHPFGGHFWRYAIPGRGIAPWEKLLRILKEADYRGMISIELEDEDFNGTEEGEKRGLLAARNYLVAI
jgi:sugar phosphate isomerase/epimerase